MIPYEKVTDEMAISFAKRVTLQRLAVAEMNIQKAMEKVEYTLAQNRSDMRLFVHTKYYKQTEELQTRLIEKKMRIYRCLMIVQEEIKERTSIWTQEFFDRLSIPKFD